MNVMKFPSTSDGTTSVKHIIVTADSICMLKQPCTVICVGGSKFTVKWLSTADVTTTHEIALLLMGTTYEAGFSLRLKVPDMKILKN